MLLIYCFAENVFHYPHLITCVHIYKILIFRSIWCNISNKLEIYFWFHIFINIILFVNQIKTTIFKPVSTWFTGIKCRLDEAISAGKIVNTWKIDLHACVTQIRSFQLPQLQKAR